MSVTKGLFIREEWKGEPITKQKLLFSPGLVKLMCEVGSSICFTITFPQVTCEDKGSYF